MSEAGAPEGDRDRDELIPAALAELLEATAAEAAELFLTDRSASRVWRAGHLGAAARLFRERTEFGRGEGFPGIVIESDEPIGAADVGADPRWLRGRVRDRGFRSYLCAPVHGGG
ncbi:MAG: GAF domain-containing protein, partial [Thermoleophilia bacterium]|nr:GAF domain-containing protein [Thermoleophilia bacterium]